MPRGKNLFPLFALLLLSVALASVGSIDSASAETSINLTPVSGAPGSMVTVTGAGFANNTRVAIIFDRYDIDQAFTDANGTFTREIFIPTVAEPGYHRIIANDGVNSVDGIFTVTDPPRISISSDRIIMGTAVTVSGSNFVSGKAITIKLDGKTIDTVPTNLKSSNYGTFSAAVNIPFMIAGKHTISATDGVLIASETIDVIELGSITLTPTYGLPSTSVTVTGSGFSENSQITIILDSKRLITTPESIIADASGKFSTVITIPIDAVGGTSIIRATDDSARTGSATFNITPLGIIKLSSNSGSAGTIVNISGSGFNPNSIVTVKLDSRIIATQGTVTTTSSGAFSSAIAIPKGMGIGSHTLTVTDQLGRPSFATFSIDAPDPLSLSKTAGIAGNSTQIFGSSFSPNSAIIISFDSMILPVTAITNNAGNFEVTIKIPDDASPGSHTISVIDALGRTTSSLFTVREPGILTMSPDIGPPGTEVVVYGSKFVNNTGVIIKFNDLSLDTFPSKVRSSAIGKFMAKFRVPLNTTEGTYTIVAEDNTGISGFNSFTVTRDGFFVSVSQKGTRSGMATITGSGFPSMSPITVKFDDEIVMTTPLKINTTRMGTFAGSFNIPGNAPNGNHTVTVTSNDVTAITTITLKRNYIDDRYGILISVAPAKYNFAPGETLQISGKVLALNNNFPLILKIINPNNAACNFQQLTLDSEMNFMAAPAKLDGTLCSVEGEYKITAFYGKGKALTKFRIGNFEPDLTGGEAEVLNQKLMQEHFRFDNKYTVDLDWATNAVLLRNNMNQTQNFYLMFIEYDTDEVTKRLSHAQVTLAPYEHGYVIAPYVPKIINGKPDGYLHVFAWARLDSPTPLHPGLYVPY
jgi:hypothetical protein